MFSEWKCRCIASTRQGLVRLCEVHAKDRNADINGNKIVRRYPGNGQALRNWSGK